MVPRKSLLVLLLASAFALSGCVATPDDSDVDSHDADEELRPYDDDSDPDGDANTGADDSSAAPPASQTTFQQIQTGPGDHSIELEVVNGTAKIEITGTVVLSGPADLVLANPGGNAAQEISTTSSHVTNEGTVFVVDAPEAGSWTLTLSGTGFRFVDLDITY